MRQQQFSVKSVEKSFALNAAAIMHALSGTGCSVGRHHAVLHNFGKSCGLREKQSSTTIMCSWRHDYLHSRYRDALHLAGQSTSKRRLQIARDWMSITE